MVSDPKAEAAEQFILKLVRCQVKNIVKLIGTHYPDIMTNQDELEDSLDRLQRDWTDVWNKVWATFEPKKSWLTDLDKRDRIKEKLSHFNLSHSNEPKHIDKVIKALTRGNGLVDAAVGWKNPAINKPKARANLEKIRGIQWRLVILYSGFEIMAKALSNEFKRNISHNMYDDFIGKCSLSDYEFIATPPNNPELKKWLDKEDEALMEFLGITGGDRRILNSWLVNSQPINSWEDSFKLAKALRNASAHGFLSPTKIDELKIKDSFRRLTLDLGTILVAALSKIV